MTLLIKNSRYAFLIRLDLMFSMSLGLTNLIFHFAGETWKKVGTGRCNKNKNIRNFYKL